MIQVGVVYMCANVMGYIPIGNSLFTQLFNATKMARPKPSKPLPVLRRTPIQGRAEHTVETFFQAIAQILEADGNASLNTNKIAEKAGFSIGTLYQYFPSKEALMFAFATRNRARVMQKISDVLLKAELEDSDPYRLLQEFVHVLVQSYASHRKLRRALVSLVWQIDRGDSAAQLQRETSDRLAVALARFSARATAAGDHTAPRFRTEPAALFVIVRAVSAAIRSASLEESAFLGTAGFEDGLVRLAWGMMTD